MLKLSTPESNRLLRSMLALLISCLLFNQSVFAQTGERCFVSPTVPAIVWAKSTWTTNTTNQTVTIRMTFSRTFVDNTYGTNVIGWPVAHSFSNLTGSDKLGWSLKDANGVVKLAFEQDYISSSASFPSGYGTLGFGGDGNTPTVGTASDVTGFLTSIDKNLNSNGATYYTVTTNSPATDNNYTPNPTYPNWIYDVWYEVTIKLSAFGAAGFGYPDIATVHASPSKTGNNTEIVNPTPCIGSLGDFVWQDNNGNGIQETGELGIQGVLVTLTKPDGSTATTTTSSTGAYLFSNLTAGNYIVTFPTTLAGGFGLTNNDQGTDNSKDSDPNQGTGVANGITIYPGQNNTTVDAGYVLSNLTLGNKVFYDANRSGVFDAGDGPIGNTIVRLYKDNNNDNIADGAAISVGFTDAYGMYSFSNLAPGNYIVGVEIPATYAITITDGGDPDNNIDNDNNATEQVGTEARGMAISLSSGSEPGGNINNTYDFGFYNPLSPPNGGQSCFAGVNPIVFAKSYWTANVNAQTVTMRVTFSKQFVDNTYGVNVIGWPGSHAYSNLTGSDHLQWSIHNGQGTEVLNFKQDYISADATAPSGYASLGFGGDGRTPTVGLGTDVLSFRSSLATNLNDYGYTYPGFTSYSPATDTNYTPNPATPNWIYDVWYEITVKASAFGASGFGFIDVASVHASPSKTGNNTEIITNNPCASGSIGDRVWVDTNKDGIQDATEVGLSGIVVTLIDNATGKVMATTVTDGYGNYKFGNLETNTTGIAYIVDFNLAPGYRFSPNNGLVTVTNNSDANSTTGRTGIITLTDAVPNVTYADAGVYYTETARVGDFVWNDLNKNGIQDAGEPGIAGVTVMLYTSLDVLYRSTVTSNNGQYFFDEVASGTYYVKIAPPIGYQVSPKDATADNLDSDIDPLTRKTPNFVVVAGTSNLTLDAGLNVTSTTGASASLGDRVWEDLNNNNLQDAGEPGIANVTVQLYNSLNVLQATVTTDAFGNYIFNGLMPGSYYVKFTLPAGFSYVTPNMGTNDMIDSDVEPSTSNSQTVALAADEINTTVDAGMRRTSAGAALGDFVWYDLNKNGVQDGGSEVGVPGVTVVLYSSSNTVVATTTTDANGFYLFTGLPAATTYTVGFENISKGYAFTTNSGATSVTTNSDVNPSTGRTAAVTTGAAGTTINYVDAGLISTPKTFNSKASVGDLVWKDLNNNGIQDAGEPGIIGATVTLYAANGTTVLATTTTDALGNYLFTNLDAGSYVLGFTGLPASYVFSAKDAGTNDTKDSDPDITTGKTAPFSLASGEINLTIDAGAHNTNTTVSAIGNFVWYDLNNNGIQDSGEPGVEGVSITLINFAGLISGTTTTSSTGEYLFTDLTAGNYFLEFANLPAGFTPGIRNATGSNDANNSDPNTSSLKTDVVVLPVSTTDPNWDFGIVTATRASLGDFVWNDSNNDGIQDPGESGVAGVTVTLYNSANQPVSSTVTDDKGFYLFSNLLPGTYSVGFATLPAATTFTKANASGGTDANNSDADPSTGRTASFTLLADQSKTDVDAGLVSLKAAVGDFVWFDTNNNGLQDPGEPGVPGTTVTMYTSTNAIIGDGDDVAVASAITDANGYYFINDVLVGSGGTQFYMRFTDLQQDLSFTLPVVGGTGASNNSKVSTQPAANGRTGFFTLSPGQIYRDVDAGIILNLSSLGDKVWRDDNSNGIQDAGEPGVSGVPVTLYLNGTDGLPGTADDVLYGATITDAYGNYRFDKLPGTNQLNATTISQTSYNVRVTPPANYSLTTQTNTTDDNNTTGPSTTGSDVNALGTSYGINLMPGENNPNIDAGLIFTNTTPPSSIGDRVWLDTNGNGNQDTGEPGVSGVTVTLYDDVTGNVLAVTTTDGNGNYIFNNLPNGTYKVGFSAPGGTLLSPNVGGTTPGNSTTNSDPDPATGKTTTITISTPGTMITGIDAGLKYDVKGAIGDFVWNDIDRDGIQDANETGVPGVTMQLYSPGLNNVIGGGDDVLVSTTTTDAKGYYIFPNLNLGKYFVVATAPAGYSVSPVDITAGNPEEDTKDCDFDANGAYPGKQVSPITALSTAGLSSRDMTIDMGLYNTTDNLNSIGDKVWNDVNGNGLQDVGEPGVANITVRLLNSTGTAVNNPATGKPYTTTTNADGIYRFGDLADGNYIVEFANIPAGFSLTKQDASGTGNPGSVTDGNNDSDPKTTTGRTGVINLDAAGSNPLSVNLVNVDAGIQQGISAGTSTLGNRVWYDLNNNGLQDAGELGVANVRAELLDGAGTAVNVPSGAIPYVVYTNALGEYMFTGLPAGDYKVRFGNFPAGFTSSPADLGTNDAIDADANFAGVSITATTVATTGTNTLQTGEDNLTVDMGIVPPSTGSNNTLGNFVWNDQNSDGKQNATEPGIAGVNVQLYSNGSDGIPGSGDDALLGVTVTDSLGRYLFAGLPDGNYNVVFINLPSGFTFTAQNAAGTTAADGSDANVVTGRTATVALDPTGLSAAGIVNNDIDAGLVTTRAALGNYVWLDSNGDGVQDATEAGISGVTVTLYGSDGTTIISSMVTDANGKYGFGNLNAGSYVVGFSTIPSNLGFTKQNTPGDNQNNSNSDAIPSTGKTGIIVLSPGEVDLTIDAGLQPNNFASVGDFVWVDLDRNGVQDVTEPGVPGVVVTLYNAANAVVGAAVTDGNGKYLINNIPAGIGYYIGFSNTIVNTLFTTQTSDVTPGDATKGSDANTTTGKTAPFSLTAGQYLPTVDAGLIKIINIYGNVWHDVNGLTNLEINPTPGATPIPNAMNIYLVDLSTGLIVQAESILLDGTFSFLDVDVNRSYKVVLSSAVAFVGDPSPIATLPSGWQRVGENLGRGPLSGSDGVPNGLLFLDTTTGDVIDADFGIRLKNGEVVIG